MASDEGGAGDLIRVSGNSPTARVAGAIAGVIRQHKYAEVQAIGAGAVNQAVKALAIATTYLAEENISIWAQPMFIEITIQGQKRTALRFIVRPGDKILSETA